MRNALMSLIITASCVLFSNTTFADFAIWDNEVLTVTGSHSNGAAYDTSTVTIVSGGNVTNVLAYNNSTLNISGGSVSGYLKGYDNSNIRLSNGSTSSFYIYNQAEMNITGGNINLGGDVSDFGVLKITGGTFTHQTAGFVASGNSHVYISGGEFKGRNHTTGSSILDLTGGAIRAIQAEDFSTINFKGGSCDFLMGLGHSTTDISGGLISQIVLQDASIINFYATEYRIGSGLTFDGTHLYGEGALSGEWANGTRWTVNIGRQLPLPCGEIVLHYVESIPEPCTLLLLCLGGLLIRRK